MFYIIKNEHTKKIKIVIGKGEKVPENLPLEIDFLNREYPEIAIEFLVLDRKFSPELIEELSKNGIFQLILCLLAYLVASSLIKLKN
ncbi:hypothetical protein [Lutibacter sp.]|uniref:hypothetical protein n=1 Tax=Lutibacter sp. TaxID=1925666 RepID=UPI003567B9B2